MDNYINNNEWKITKSKLWLFKQCPEAYKRVYEDKEDTSFIEKSPSLEMWTMIDQYILDPKEFGENYAFPCWGGLKQDFIDACISQNIPVMPKDTVDMIKAKLYGNKKVISVWDAKKLICIAKELRRQILFDYHTEYEVQVVVEATYKGLVLKGTIDRLSVELWLIRDLKTSKDIVMSNYHWVSMFENMLVNNDEYGYIFQLSFYWLLCTIKYGQGFVCIIDWVKTSWNYASQFFQISQETIQKTVNDEIIPLLDMLVKYKETGKIEEVERENLLGNKYYPMLDNAIQKDFISITN